MRYLGRVTSGDSGKRMLKLRQKKLSCARLDEGRRSQSSRYSYYLAAQHATAVNDTCDHAVKLVQGGDVPFYCTVCRLSLSGEAQVRERSEGGGVAGHCLPVPALPAS